MSCFIDCVSALATRMGSEPTCASSTVFRHVFLYRHLVFSSGSRRGDGRERCGRGHGRSQETNLVADGNHSEEPTRLVQHSLEFAFTVEQLTGNERKSGDLITMIFGGVAVSDIIVDSGATCNVVRQQTWEMIKLKGINCESCMPARELFAYGGMEPLKTLGTFTADALLTGNNSGCRADFVVVKGNG